MQPPTFRTVIEAPSPALGLPLSVPQVLLGSCFAQTIGSRLSSDFFPSLVNPFGIIYHPFAIAHHLEHLQKSAVYHESDLVQHDGRWVSLYHHGDFSADSPAELLDLLNRASDTTQAWLNKKPLLVLSFGTSWSYWHHKTETWAANCHRLPGSDFTRRVTTSAEMTECLLPALTSLLDAHPELSVVLTVSPVRHLRDQPSENSLSKAHLVILCQALAERIPRCRYFPAYEMLLDDLRDYRFYGQDLCHPSELAIDYIYSHYIRWAYANTDAYLQETLKLKRRLTHRPQRPESAEYKRFTVSTDQQIKAFTTRYPHSILPPPPWSTT